MTLEVFLDGRKKWVAAAIVGRSSVVASNAGLGRLLRANIRNTVAQAAANVHIEQGLGAKMQHIWPVLRLNSLLYGTGTNREQWHSLVLTKKGGKRVDLRVWATYLSRVHYGALVTHIYGYHVDTRGGEWIAIFFCDGLKHPKE